MWQWTFEITFDSNLDPHLANGLRTVLTDDMLDSLQEFIPTAVKSPLRLFVVAETGKEAKEQVMQLAKQAVCNAVPVKEAKLVDLQEVK